MKYEYKTVYAHLSGRNSEHFSVNKLNIYNFEVNDNYKMSDFENDNIKRILSIENELNKNINELAADGWEYVDTMSISSHSILLFRRVCM